jgi:hypothetical protein
LDDSREPDYVVPSIQGYNAWPYDSGKSLDSNAILDTGANSTYVTHRLLLENTTLPSSESVLVADGTAHTITASGTLLGHPSIQADLVPSFHQNLIGVSPILNKGALGIIKQDKMVLLARDPYVEKLVDFAINYSERNNLIIMTGSKSHGLYIHTNKLIYLFILIILITFMIWFIIFILFLIALMLRPIVNLYRQKALQGYLSN